jgi:peroxiredoxin
LLESEKRKKNVLNRKEKNFGGGGHVVNNFGSIEGGVCSLFSLKKNEEEDTKLVSNRICEM